MAGPFFRIAIAGRVSRVEYSHIRLVSGGVTLGARFCELPRSIRAGLCGSGWTSHEIFISFVRMMVELRQNVRLSAGGDVVSARPCVLSSSLMPNSKTGVEAAGWIGFFDVSWWDPFFCICCYFLGGPVRRSHVTSAAIAGGAVAGGAIASVPYDRLRRGRCRSPLQV